MSENCCAECGGRLTKDDREFTSCESCGLESEEPIFLEGQEDKRNFSADVGNSRSQTNAETHDLHNKGLGTDITGNKDFYGRNLNYNQRMRANRLRLWQSRTLFRDSTAKLTKDRFQDISKWGGKFPEDVVKKAKYLYTLIRDKHLIRGRNSITVAADSLYSACCLLGVPTTFSEISDLAGVPIKELRRNHRTMGRFIPKFVTTPVSETDYLTKVHKTLERLCSDLQVNFENRKGLHALLDRYYILNQARNCPVLSRSPKSVIPALVYDFLRGTEGKRTQKEIIKYAGITEVTLRNNLRLLEQHFFV
jgi:transcription initiation factor TFIIB